MYKTVGQSGKSTAFFPSKWGEVNQENGGGRGGVD